MNNLDDANNRGGGPPVTIFDCEDIYGGQLGVERICPKCGRFVAEGTIMMNGLGEVTELKGWICKKHGEVSPNWYWLD